MTSAFFVKGQLDLDVFTMHLQYMHTTLKFVFKEFGNPFLKIDANGEDQKVCY